MTRLKSVNIKIDRKIWSLSSSVLSHRVGSTDGVNLEPDEYVNSSSGIRAHNGVLRHNIDLVNVSREAQISPVFDKSVKVSQWCT